MGSIKTHRTWPCRHQESYEIKGFWVLPSADGEPDPKQCPIHGVTCPKLPTSLAPRPGGVA